MHVAGFLADECFVGFDMPGHLLFERSLMQSEADAVIQKPGSLLGDPNGARNFITADSIRVWLL
jgi:hypothetical protein